MVQNFPSQPRKRGAPAGRRPRTVSALARHLTADAETDFHAAEAIFRWITANIAYRDGPGLPAGRNGAPDPQAVLSRGHALCGGISELFAALAREAGLEAEVIHGHSKGRGFAPGKNLPRRPDHAWNAVRVDGAWRLVDATWGSGAFHGKDYRRGYEPHYFGTAPEAFATDHFPTDPEWQLLPQPLTREAFQGLPLYKAPFFHLGLQPLHGRGGIIQAKGELRLGFGLPRGGRLLAELWARGRRLSRTLAFAHHLGKKAEVRVRFSRPGAHLLRIFARGAGESGAFDEAVTYRVEAARAWGSLPAFPETFAAFTDSGAELREPVQGRLKSGGRPAFDLIVPGAQEVALAAGRLWFPLQRNGEQFTGRFVLPRGEVTLAALFSTGGKHQVLLKFRAE